MFLSLSNVKKNFKKTINDAVVVFPLTEEYICL